MGREDEDDDVRKRGDGQPSLWIFGWQSMDAPFCDVVSPVLPLLIYPVCMSAPTSPISSTHLSLDRGRVVTLGTYSTTCLLMRRCVHPRPLCSRCDGRAD